MLARAETHGMQLKLGHLVEHVLRDALAILLVQLRVLIQRLVDKLAHCNLQLPMVL